MTRLTRPARVPRRLLDALGRAPLMVWITGGEAPVSFADRTWLSAAGWRNRILLEGRWTESIHPEDRDPSIERFDEAVRHERAVALQYRVRLMDGACRPVQEYAFPLHDGRVLSGYVGLCIDVADLRESPGDGSPERSGAAAPPFEPDAPRVSDDRLRDLAAHFEAAREDERRELARTLHDEIGQLLTGVRLEMAGALGYFQEAVRPEALAVVDRLQAAVGLLDLSIATVRRIATTIRPPLLDHVGLLGAIRWEAAVFQQRTGIRCRVYATPAHLETKRHVTVLYRILVEALTNVARHAGAGAVRIYVRQRPGRLTLEVRDNGRGITEDAINNPDTIGLLGIRERARAVGGEARIARVPAGGTSVVVTLPVESGNDDPHRDGDAQDPHRR